MTKSSIIHVFWNIILILIITILILELVGVFIFDNRYQWNYGKRYLWFSKDTYSNKFSNYPESPEKKFWTFKENSKIRFIATYADVLGIKKEFDCLYDINKHGFIDTGNQGLGVDFIVLGDSFTFGSGGCSWLNKRTIQERNELKDLNIINGGLPGYGILGFERVLEFHQRFYNIKNVVVIVISNDFKRGLPNHRDIYNSCYKQLNCKDGLWHYVNLEITDEQIKAGTLKRMHLNKKRNKLKEFLHYSFTIRVIDDFYNIFKKPVVENNDSSLFNKNFEALLRIRKKFENLSLIIVPQRDEVGFLGVENLDTSNVIKFLEKEKINYIRCPINSNDYMPLDAHPNPQGYKKLMVCLSEVINN